MQLFVCMYIITLVAVRVLISTNHTFFNFSFRDISLDLLTTKKEGKRVWILQKAEKSKKNKNNLHFELKYSPNEVGTYCTIAANNNMHQLKYIKINTINEEISQVKMFEFLKKQVILHDLYTYIKIRGLSYAFMNYFRIKHFDLILTLVN